MFLGSSVLLILALSGVTGRTITADKVGNLLKYGYLGEGVVKDTSASVFGERRVRICGNAENHSMDFTAGKPWANRTISWHWYGPIEYVSVVEAAFSLWQRYASLTFVTSRSGPNISIRMVDAKHTRGDNGTICFMQFDGRGGILAHAYLPGPGVSQVDIHLDRSEDWVYTYTRPEPEQTSFYFTLVHEIGHALGLSHSSEPGSVMFSWYKIPDGIRDMREIDLHRDDINGIRFLYGMPPSTSRPRLAPRMYVDPKTTTVKPSVKPRVNGPPTDLCEYKDTTDTTLFLVADKRIYAFHRRYVWVLSLDELKRHNSQLTTPKLITSYLSFLPTNFNNISAVLERSNGDLVFFVDRDVYTVEYPTMALKSRSSIQDLTGFNVNRVNAAFTSNKGSMFLIFNDGHVLRLDECSMRGRYIGQVSKVFPDVPIDVTGAFRYTNGLLYFITPGDVYEFSEFYNAITRKVDDSFAVFKIECYKDLVSRLYEALHGLVRLRASD